MTHHLTATVPVIHHIPPLRHITGRREKEKRLVMMIREITKVSILGRQIRKITTVKILVREITKANILAREIRKITMVKILVREITAVNIRAREVRKITTVKILVSKIRQMILVREISGRGNTQGREMIRQIEKTREITLAREIRQITTEKIPVREISQKGNTQGKEMILQVEKMREITLAKEINTRISYTGVIVAVAVVIGLLTQLSVIDKGSGLENMAIVTVIMLQVEMRNTENLTKMKVVIKVYLVKIPTKNTS